MRFFEYESRRIVAKAGIPVSAHGFATTPEEARELAAGIGAPTVIKSQVLTGGRMKAGGVKFADTPAEAAAHAEAILALEIGGHMPRGVLVDSRVAVQAGVLRGRHLGRDAQAPGADLLRHGRDRHRGGRGDPPRPRRPRPLLDAAAVLRLRGQAGDRLGRRDRPGADPPHPDPDPARAAVPRVRHDARRDQPARRARGRELRRGRRAHGHGERGAPAPGRPAAGARRRRRGDAPGARGDAVRARGRGGRRAGPPRRGRERDGVRRRHRAGDRRRRRLADAVRRGPRARRAAGELLRDRRQPVGREGLRPGQARAAEAGRRQDRGDDVDRLEHARRHRRARGDQGVRRARLRPGGEDRHLPDPRRVGGGGLQAARALRGPLRGPVGVAQRGRAARGGGARR